MARNEELNKKFQETVIGAKIAREMTVVLNRLNRLDNLINEAKLKIENGEAIVSIFTVPEEIEQINDLFVAIQQCTAVKEALKLINEPDPI
jgi:hypothetical protein